MSYYDILCYVMLQHISSAGGAGPLSRGAAKLDQDKGLANVVRVWYSQYSSKFSSCILVQYDVRYWYYLRLVLASWYYWYNVRSLIIFVSFKLESEVKCLCSGRVRRPAHVSPGSDSFATNIINYDMIHYNILYYNIL